LTTEQADDAKRSELEERGAQVIPCGAGPRVDLKEALLQLGQKGIASILLEGGGTLNGSMLEQMLVDRLIQFIAPKIIGGYDAPGNYMFSGYEQMNQAISLTGLETERLGDNIYVTGIPVWK
jgi:diaminohydroxyphosphoribosylaminopyrimidine deaminase/5-amino-6-(5-phosphoribosylamino)uracil reductase